MWRVVKRNSYGKTSMVFNSKTGEWIELSIDPATDRPVVLVGNGSYEQTIAHSTQRYRDEKFNFECIVQHYGLDT